MSWLKKIVSKMSGHNAERMAEVVDAMPAAQCLTVEPASANTAGQENKNPAEPRRYFIKADLLRGAIVPPSVTAEPALAVGVAQEDENSTHQRRYFVKKGKWVDNEEERARAGAVDSAEEIIDRRPVDLKTLFPKLSLR
ncbi:MAG: hypothetical protein WB999_12585 [Candidatus Binataceae bacterium]|jgi:hypothetical protein